jgi:hypothetical protein
MLMRYRIGTFFGHKGAVYQARLSPDAATAATASADFTAFVIPRRNLLRQANILPVKYGTPILEKL